MRKISFLNSIQVKMGLLLILILTGVLSLYGVYQYWQTRSEITRELNLFADSRIRKLQEQLRMPLWEADRLLIDLTISSEMGDSRIFAISVNEENTGSAPPETVIRVIKSRSEDGTPELVNEKPDQAGYIVRSEKILHKEKHIGTVELYVTRKLMHQRLKQATVQILNTMIILNLALLVFLLLLQNRLVIRPVRHLLEVTDNIAEGDFTREITIRQNDEIGQLAETFRHMKESIGHVLRELDALIRAAQVGNREMSVVAEQMSEGASQQAAATEEVSASMEEMATNIRQTADNTRQAEQISRQSAEEAQTGMKAVTKLIEAMKVIAERVFVIQEIASQTNMLSLNATIEASKAQEYGKGFNVVASSVRDLAAQTRHAANEIRSLVMSSVTLSTQTGEVLQRLVPNSQKTAELVQEISFATQEQSHGIEQVNAAIQQLDLVTRQNAETSQGLASTAETLTKQADALQTMMAFFTVKEVVPEETQKEDKSEYPVEDR